MADNTTAKATQKVLEETTDVIEQTLDTLDHVKPTGFNLNGTTKGQQIAILTGAVLVGAGVGYFLTRKFVIKKLKAEYIALAEKEIAEAKEHYAHLAAVKEKPKSPEAVLAERHGTKAAYDEAMVSYSGTSEAVMDEPVTAPIEEKHNIFTDAEPVDRNVFDYAAELKVREEHPERPYIISEEEFDQNETEYEQSHMTWYDGDDTLADDQDMTVPDPDTIVGSDNLTRFGYGANDQNSLYVRNDALEIDFEIKLDLGKYQVKVLGFEDPEKELQHSHRPRSRRRNNWDDDDE